MDTFQKRQSELLSRVFDMARGKSVEELQDLRSAHDCNCDSCGTCLKIDELIDGQVDDEIMKSKE